MQPFGPDPAGVSAGAAPGWYPDPAGRHQVRWFDGRIWTEDVADNGVTGKEPIGWSGPPTAYATPPSGPAGTRLAGYGTRLGGWLIDWVLVSVVTIPLLVLTHSIHHTQNVVISNGTIVTRQNGYHVDAGGIALHALIVIAYGALLCGARRGQTLGMMAVGVKVVDEHLGGPIGFGRALWRAVFEYAMSILLFIPWVIDMLFPLWDPKNQTLHDKVSKAVVVVTQ
jgi:uncharacterized RDD family membrane protein YckC